MELKWIKLWEQMSSSKFQHKHLYPHITYNCLNGLKCWKNNQTQPLNLWKSHSPLDLKVLASKTKQVAKVILFIISLFYINMAWVALLVCDRRL